MICIIVNRLSHKYQMMEELGRGAFATVRLAVNLADGSKYAIKIEQLTSGEVSRFDLAPEHYLDMDYKV